MAGFFISIGAIIDESQEHRHICNRDCPKSRQLLLIMWLVAGYVITMCYRSVLLSNMVNIGHEKPIDTIEDLLHSGLTFYCPDNYSGRYLMNTDPRASVRKLVERQLQFYQLTRMGSFFGSPKSVRER